MLRQSSKCGFRDRAGDVNKEFERYQALDLYTVLALTTESEWDESLALRDEIRTRFMFVEAARIVKLNF